MHRTQILLEPYQYQCLKAKAHENNVSIGELVRQLINRFLGEKNLSDQLDDYCGAFDDKECQSTNFKKFIYSHAGKTIR